MTPEERTVRELFAALDAGDIEDALGLMTEDVDFRFGSANPVVGHTAISAQFATMAAADGRCVTIRHGAKKQW